jgi:hypothetical protein
MNVTVEKVNFTIAPALADVFTDDGLIDARLLAQALGKSKIAPIARALGVKEDTLRHNPTSELAQARAHALVDALDELYRYIPDWKSCLIWLNRRYPGTGGKSPMKYIDTGNIEVFADLVRAFGTGAPA